MLRDPSRPGVDLGIVDERAASGSRRTERSCDLPAAALRFLGRLGSDMRAEVYGLGQSVGLRPAALRRASSAASKRRLAGLAAERGGELFRNIKAPNRPPSMPNSVLTNSMTKNPNSRPSPIAGRPACSRARERSSGAMSDAFRSRRCDISDCNGAITTLIGIDTISQTNAPIDAGEQPGDRAVAGLNGLRMVLLHQVCSQRPAKQDPCATAIGEVDHRQCREHADHQAAEQRRLQSLLAPCAQPRSRSRGLSLLI